ncbi:MAG: sugar transferase [Candidatus Krumholzibacteria bacterium]|nr:sugar transferase [Candidatus Krumholzibacteria bacterium]
MSGIPEVKEIIQTAEGSLITHVDIPDVHDRLSFVVLKRIFDVIVAIAILIFFLPVIPVIIILIKLDSPGHILFKQKRVGKDGKSFDFYKFRSMFTGAENVVGVLRPLSGVDGPIFKLKEDPRVTRVGRFLRRSSLDELPQLFNVIKGDMSIVGPRPNLPSEVAHYLPWQKKRLDVIPGITCFWQISGRSHIGFQEWMRLDLEYIRKRSLMTDMMIIIRTIPAVIARKGAY